MNVAFDRLRGSQQIFNMMALLAKSGRGNFQEPGTWETSLCAIIMVLEPDCKPLRMMEALPYHARPMDEADVLNTMAHLGYVCRPAESALEAIDRRLLPGLFIPRRGAPCIVLGHDEAGQLMFYDPATQLISQAPPSLDAEGKVWFFQPYDDTRQPTSKFMRKGSGHSWFRALLGRFGGTFMQVMAAGLILNFIALATPLFIMLVYDRVIAGGNMEALPMLALGALMAILLEWKLRRIRSTGLSWLAGRLDNIVGNKIFAHLIGLSPDLIEKASVAAQIARIKTFESVRDFFSGSVFLSLLEAPYVVLSVAAVALIAGPLVLVPLAMVAAYVALFYFMRQQVKVAIRLAAKASSARQQFTIEALEKLHGIRGHGLGGKWEEKFRHLSGREMMTHFHLGWLGSLAETGAHTLTVLSAVATLGFGVHLIWAGEMSIGALVASMILVWRIMGPFYSLCAMIPRLEQLRNSILQVNNLIEIDTEAEEAKSHSRLNKIKGAVSFHHVSFHYAEGGDNVFSDLSFAVKPGELVAVTGGNGTGKATVLKLIKSMHRPSSGTVRIDGFDIRQLDAPFLRRHIAYVPKQPYFFEGTVIENLRLANPLAGENDVLEALALADAKDDILALPHGIHTPIGAESAVTIASSLSSRLSLARAYLHPAPLLLIDALPNALLSSQAGKNLREYLQASKGRRTVVLCTYRDDFMEIADSIVWLRGTEPPMSGTREQLFNTMQHHWMEAA